MFDENFWVLLSLIVFTVSLYRPIKNVIINILDSKASQIVHELNEARRLKNEALEALETVQREYKEVQTNAEEIIEKAKLESKAILEEVKKQAAGIIEKRTALFMQRIIQQEEQIVRDIKREAIDTALFHVERRIIEELEHGIKLDLIDDSIKSLKRSIH